MPGCVQSPRSPASSGFCETGSIASTHVLLRAQAQTGRNPCHCQGKGSSVPGSQGFLVTPSVRSDVVATSPGILGVIKNLGVELPLGVVGLCAETVPKVCSGHSPEGTQIYRNII